MQIPHIQANLKLKLLATGVVLALGPLLVLGAVVRHEFYEVLDVAQDGCTRLASAGLDHIAESVYSDCAARQSDILTLLQVARGVLHRHGAAALTGAPVSWQARNQLTNQTVVAKLPAMAIGGASVGCIRDARANAPIVDEVRDLAGSTCTLFQRMNPAGDMLRIATNVLTKDGQRAIGTYIPAVGVEGEANPVVASVLRKEAYLGRAFVVDSWYMTAYEAIRDAHGDVIGMLYVGVPETAAAEKAQAFLSRAKVGEQGYVFALHASGTGRGQYVFSTNRSAAGFGGWESRDGGGEYFIQEFAHKASSLAPRQVAEHRHVAVSRDGTRVPMITRLKYFAPWDWVIGVTLPEREYLETANRIDAIAGQARLWIVAMIALGALVSTGVWLRYAGYITGNLTMLVARLQSGAEQLAHSAEQISDSSQSQAQGASEQATSLESTAAACKQLDSTAQQTTAHSQAAFRAVAGSEKHSQQAAEMLGCMQQSMSDIKSASDKIAGIVRVIDDIAFQTNILALNASVEAARAGDAGLGFSVVADEVRGLAQRCREAAENTTLLIEDCVAKSHDGTTTLDRLSVCVRTIAEGSATMKRLSEQTESSTKEQAHGTGQIAKSLAEMDRVVQATAASAEECASVSEELRAQARDIREQMLILADLVNGAPAPQAASQA